MFREVMNYKFEQEGEKSFYEIFSGNLFSNSLRGWLAVTTCGLKLLQVHFIEDESQQKLEAEHPSGFYFIATLLTNRPVVHSFGIYY